MEESNLQNILQSFFIFYFIAKYFAVSFLFLSFATPKTFGGQDFIAIGRQLRRSIQRQQFFSSFNLK